MYLQLRGLCPDTNLDRFYVPRNKERSGALILIGLKTSLVAYDKADLSAMFDVIFESTTLQESCFMSLYHPLVKNRSRVWERTPLCGDCWSTPTTHRPPPRLH